MDKKKKMINLGGRQYFSESFKKFIVRQVETGKLNKEEAKYKYKIGGNSAVLNWCRKYGKSQHYQPKHYDMSKENFLESVYKRRIQELEKELSQAKLRVSYLECVIEVAEEDMGVQIEKKSGVRPLTNTGAKIVK